MSKKKINKSIILRHQVKMRKLNESESTTLDIEFKEPAFVEESKAFLAEVEIRSILFHQKLKIFGDDQVQALLLLLGQVHGALQMREEEGYIFFDDDGRIRPVDRKFWGVSGNGIYAYQGKRKRKAP